MQILASEDGRTSHGSMGLMIKYVEFLNHYYLPVHACRTVLPKFAHRTVGWAGENQPPKEVSIHNPTQWDMISHNSSGVYQGAVRHDNYLR